MTLFALPVLYALFAWWFSTGAIFYLDGLPRRSFPWSMAVATLLAGLAVYGLVGSHADTTPTGGYVAFTSALTLWAWLEMTYYMGFLTGPRRHACHEGCAGWRHFGHAVQSSLYHELATIGLAALINVVTWGSANQVGLWTFVVLWWMQVSAKLNVFLGVPNLNEEFLPEHLGFLRSFLTKKPMNLLFPVSVTVSIVLATLVTQKAVAVGATPFEVTGFTFLATLMALAILEHWFLVLPIPVAALWRWSLGSRVAQLDQCGETESAASAGPDQGCATRLHSGTPDGQTASQRRADQAFPRNLVSDVLAEARFTHPTAAPIVRRPI